MPALTPLLVLLQCFQHLVAFKLATEAEDSASEGYDSWCVWGISFRLEDAPGKRLRGKTNVFWGCIFAKSDNKSSIPEDTS